MRPEARARAWRLGAAAALAVPAVLVLAALPPMARALAALVLVVLPGYLIAWPILRPRLGYAGAFTVAGGVAIGMIVIAGLLLNLLPWGLQATTWLAYVGAALLIALVLDRPRIAWRPTGWAIPHELVLGGIGASMLVAALLVARLFAGAPTESFTQLWVAPSADAPESVVVVSIRSEEAAATGYRLEVRRDGALVASWPEIQLTTGEEWSATLTAGSGRIEARLFLLSDPGTLYRYVTVRLAPTGEGAAGSGG